MMPYQYSNQGQGIILPGSSPGPGWNYAGQYPVATPLTSSKRPVEDDDDIQFVSEKPVKRRRGSEKQPLPNSLQHPMVPLAPNVAIGNAATFINHVPIPPTTASQMPGGDPKDTERRLSTGMVGLPSDIQTMELAYGLRGVSMPVLEKFVLNQPPRRSRLPSTPQLSPKQLPPMIIQKALDTHPGQRPPEAGVYGVVAASNNSMPCQTSRHATPYQVEKPAMASEQEKAIVPADQTSLTMAPSISYNHGAPVYSGSGSKESFNFTQMPLTPPTPGLPYPGLPRDIAPGSSPRSIEDHHHHTFPAHPQHSCQGCSRLRHQAQVSRMQGMPLVNSAIPPQFLPQLQYHAPYPHVHPQMLPMTTGNMQQYTSNYTPMMLPMNGSTFAPLPSQPLPQNLVHSTLQPQQQKGGEKDGQADETPIPTKSPQINQPKNTTADTSTASSPTKPPTSLIQPTYRKPSPNLIVDVAETCQEKFPFEEVAKRHNVPVEKVFDVFAAIIQVPLLRCPTDRRRAGKLGTARVKEYNKAKKDVLDIRSNAGEASDQGARVDPMNVAQRLGPVEFPKGFKLGGK
ncbi:hypothetical protein F4808DRAFT_407659 [Astrocystis sublimbata]|nr:hypothetical protein F4808DRAFT_407659 [Astrocystis sublimbata]